MQCSGRVARQCRLLCPLAPLSSPCHHLLDTDGDNDGEHGETEDDQEGVLLIRQDASSALDAETGGIQYSIHSLRAKSPHAKTKVMSEIELRPFNRFSTHRCGNGTGSSLTTRFGGITETAAGAAGGVCGVAAEGVEYRGWRIGPDELDVGFVAWHTDGRHLDGVLRARLQPIDSPLKIAAGV